MRIRRAGCCCEYADNYHSRLLIRRLDEISPPDIMRAAPARVNNGFPRDSPKFKAIIATCDLAKISRREGGTLKPNHSASGR